MEYFGLIGIGVAVLYGLLSLSDSVKSVAKQMKRQNFLRESELRARGVAIEASEADESKE